MKNKPATTICIAGKNDIACLFLEWALNRHPQAGKYVVVCNADDPGKHTWQRSLRFTAEQLRVPEVSLDDVYSLPELLFISLEFDRIVDVTKFRSEQLFNLHFSALPKYRGVATSVWPLLFGDSTSGVTLHRIDSGIDTGGIVSQDLFDIHPDWTARDLYYSYLEKGLRLIQREFSNLLTGQVTARPQTATGATYFGRNEIDFASPKINFRKTAWQVHNSIRAFSFHEYQFPVHPEAGPILRSRISNKRSIARAGEYIPASQWSGSLATLDFDLELYLSPHKDLFAWCCGDGNQPEAISELPEMVDLNQVDGNGWSPLVVAAYHGKQEACQWLLQNGADPNATGLRGTHPLMYAKDYFLASGDDSILRLLLQFGANVNQTDVHGKNTRDYIECDAKAKPLLSLLESK